MERQRYGTAAAAAACTGPFLGLPPSQQGLPPSALRAHPAQRVQHAQGIASGAGEDSVKLQRRRSGKGGYSIGRHVGLCRRASGPAMAYGLQDGNGGGVSCVVGSQVVWSGHRLARGLAGAAQGAGAWGRRSGALAGRQQQQRQVPA